MTLATSTSSFRGYRYVWNGMPIVPPALAVSAPAASKTALEVSWNGATGVASWTVLAGSLPATLAAVGSFPSTGFETAISAPTVGPFVRLQALSATGQLLGQSQVVKVP